MKLQKFKLNKDFRRLYGRGKSFVSPCLVTYVLRSRNQGVRFGITVSKKLGGAVQRNRAKRIITAAFRNICPEIEGGYEFCFVARTRILSMKSTEVERILRAHLAKAGVFSDNSSL